MTNVDVVVGSPVCDNPIRSGEYCVSDVSKESVMCAKRYRQKEVLLLETQAADQQQLVSETPAEAAEVVSTFRGHLEQAFTFWQDAAHEADTASRRLCEALAEGRGKLQMLCHGATQNPSPELAKVLQWLEKQHFRKDQAGGRTLPFLKLLLLRAVWLAAVWILLPRKKTVKKE